MALQKTRYTKKNTANKRKTETELLAEAVEKLQKAALVIYDLGVPLRSALRMTNLTPAFYQDIFSFYEGKFEDATTRSAFRSACWRMKIQEGVADEESCYVHVLLGPYKIQPTQKEEKYLAWLADFFLYPFNFKRMAEEMGHDADMIYHVYHSTMPVPRSVLEQVRGLLCVNKPEFTAETERQAFALLEQHYAGPVTLGGSP